MEVTNQTYSLIKAKLDEMEQAIIQGFNQGTEPKACLEVRTLVFEINQILNQNFIVGGNDEPPAA